MRLLSIAVGGAIGALLRYAVSGLAYDWLGSEFPWGTLAVNLIGCFVIGFLWQLFDSQSLSPNARALIFTGGLGAFTTFSTFGLESSNLLRDGQTRLALTNVAVSNLLGILFVFLGFAGARLLLARWR